MANRVVVALSIDEEKEISLTGIRFKQKLLLSLTSMLLSMMRDILLGEMIDMQSKYAHFYNYIEKIHSKQFTARFVSNRGA